MIRRYCVRLGAGRFLLLWAFTLAFGFSGRSSSERCLSAHVLGILNDQYYFIFAVLPILLFFCGSVMEDDAEIVIFRYGTYRRYFVAKWTSLGMLCSGLWLGQIVILFLTGLGLPISADGWGGFSSSSLYRDIAALLATYFSSPWVALLCAAVFLLIGYWLISCWLCGWGIFFRNLMPSKFCLLCMFSPFSASSYRLCPDRPFVTGRGSITGFYCFTV